MFRLVAVLVMFVSVNSTSAQFVVPATDEELEELMVRRLDECVVGLKSESGKVRKDAAFTMSQLVDSCMEAEKSHLVKPYCELILEKFDAQPLPNDPAELLDWEGELNLLTDSVLDLVEGQLVARAKSGDLRKRLSAISILDGGRWEQRSSLRDFWRTTLDDPAPLVKQVAIQQVMVESPAPPEEIVDRVVGFTRHPDKTIRAAAVQSLDPKIYERDSALFDRLEKIQRLAITDVAASVRVSAFSNLHDLAESPEGRLKILLQQFGDRDNAVAVAACYEFECLLTYDDDPQVTKVQLSVAAGRMAELLRAFADDSVRLGEVLDALRVCGAAGSIAEPEVRQLLESNDLWLAGDAVAAYHAISGDAERSVAALKRILTVGTTLPVSDPLKDHTTPRERAIYAVSDAVTEQLKRDASPVVPLLKSYLTEFEVGTDIWIDTTYIVLFAIGDDLAAWEAIAEVLHELDHERGADLIEGLWEYAPQNAAKAARQVSTKVPAQLREEWIEMVEVLETEEGRGDPIDDL